jgi:hypothetical protein
MPATATFKIETSFNITSLGVVAVGAVLEGSVGIGNKSVINIQGKLSKVIVKTLGMGRPDNEGIMKWGLFFTFENPDHEKLAIEYRIQEQIIKLYS